MIKNIAYWLLSASLLLISCTKEAETTIPDWSFRPLDCDMRQAAYISLRSPGEFIEISSYQNGYPIGYAGIIVGLSSTVMDFNGELEYFAFDSACPVEADRSVAVRIDDGDRGKATCPKCAARFDLNNGGTPISGSDNFMKRYTVIKVSQDIIRITGD